MTWPLWIACIGLFGSAAYQLWRAARFGKIVGGISDITRSNSPFMFWFQVTMFTIVAVLFGGGMLLVAVGALRIL